MGQVGVWLRVFEALAAASPQSMPLIDSSIIRAHPACCRRKGGLEHAIGHSRGALTRKIHVVPDESGLPVRLAPAAGQASDKAAAPELLERPPAACIVAADRGYDGQHLVDLVVRGDGQAQIPTQRDHKVQRWLDPAICRQRNLVERFLCKLKYFICIAPRYDKLARNYLAAVAIAAVQRSGRTSRSAIITGTSPDASVTDARVWQLAFLPGADAYCGAIPAEARPSWAMLYHQQSARHRRHQSRRLPAGTAPSPAARCPIARHR